MEKPYVVKNITRTSERRASGVELFNHDKPFCVRNGWGGSCFPCFFFSRRSSNAFGPAHWCDSCKSARREIGFIHDASIGEDVGVSKNRGILPPKMDGENKGSKPYEQMDDLGGFW